MFSKLFTKILLPYDGSNFSKKALIKAIEVAHNLDSEILLFSVLNLTYLSPPGMLHGIVRSKSEKEAIKKWNFTAKINTQKMLEMAVSKCKKNGVSANFTISKGDIANEILDFAKKKKVTIIIIGSQGLHGIGKIKTLGSVSRKVSEMAHCPVLIVR